MKRLVSIETVKTLQLVPWPQNPNETKSLEETTELRECKQLRF